MSAYVFMDRDYARFLLDKTREDYNTIAEEFSRTRQYILPEIRFLFEDYIKPGQKILDLGCGNGRNLALVRENDGQYWGVDNSVELIKIARREHPNVNFQLAEALNLPFSDNFFDFIYSIAVLHHIPSREFRQRFLQEAQRVLKPNGFLILTVWKPQGKKATYLFWKYWWQKVLGCSRMDFGDVLETWGKKVERYYHRFSKRELERLVREVGLKIEKSGVISNEQGNRQNLYLVAHKGQAI